MNKKKTTYYTVNGIIILIAITISVNLFRDKYPQIIFNLSSEIAFLFILFDVIRGRVKLPTMNGAVLFFISLIIVACVRGGWYFYESYSLNYQLVMNTAINNLQNYQLQAKRLLMGTVTAIYVYKNREKISAVTICISALVIMLGIITTTFFSIHQYLASGEQRTKLNVDAASSSSYIVLFMYCSVISMLRYVRTNLAIIIYSLSSVSSIITLYLCNTRVSFIAFLLVFLSSLFYMWHIFNPRKHVKWILYIIILSVCIPVLSGRWKEGINDIKEYKYDDSTSLGARIAIWSAAMDFSESNLWFSSPQARTITTRNYIKNNFPENKEAWKNVQYNMHNEFLETLSLQGVIGVISLVVFYLSFLFGVITKTIPHQTFYPVISLFICGMSDSVLINPQSTMIFISAIILSFINPAKKYFKT